MSHVPNPGMDPTPKLRFEERLVAEGSLKTHLVLQQWYEARFETPTGYTTWGEWVDVPIELLAAKPTAS